MTMYIIVTDTYIILQITLQTSLAKDVKVLKHEIVKLREEQEVYIS